MQSDTKIATKNKLMQILTQVRTEFMKSLDIG